MKNLEDEHEFWLWYKEHEAHLRYYSLREVCALARACGFDLSPICRNVDHWLTMSRNKLRLWESPLFGNWVRVTMAQKGHDGIGG